MRPVLLQAATERFLDVAEITSPPRRHEQVVDNILAAAHHALTGVEFLRVLAGAGSNTKDTLKRVTDYVPSEGDVGGLFDDVTRAKRIYSATKQKG